MTQNTCSGCPVQQGTHKSAGAVHQIVEPDQRVSDAAIDAIFDGMPDGGKVLASGQGDTAEAACAAAIAASAAKGGEA